MITRQVENHAYIEEHDKTYRNKKACFNDQDKHIQLQRQENHNESPSVTS